MTHKRVIGMRVSKYNAAGYPDLTAKLALDNIESKNTTSSDQNIVLKEIDFSRYSEEELCAILRNALRHATGLSLRPRSDPASRKAKMKKMIKKIKQEATYGKNKIRN